MSLTNLLTTSLKVGAKGPSETSVISTRLHGVTHNKAVKFYEPGIHRNAQVQDYQIVPALTSVLQIIICYCWYTWSAQLIIRIFHLDIFFICWSRDLREKLME